MKKQDIQKLICLGLCLVLFAVMSVAVPDFWNWNINYKNNPLDAQIPNQADSEVADINFTLPVLYIYSHDIEKLMPFWQWTEDGPVMPLREESTVDIYLFDRESNNVGDIPSRIYYGDMMKLRGRTSSYMQDKKPFSLEIRDERGQSEDCDFMGFAPESDFVFHAPFIDRSLVRNFVAYTLQTQITDWAPHCQFAEVFVDTPDSTLTMEDYQGVYLIVEKIKQDKNRIPMGDYHTPKNMDSFFSEGGNIIWKRDTYEEGYDTAIRLEKNRYGNGYSVAYPKAEKTNEDAVNAISTEIELLEKALYEGSDEEFAQYYDVQQIARVMLLTEFVKNYEGFTSSLFYYRPNGEKIKAIQWDFDIGTGNVDYRKNLDNAREFSVLTNEKTQAYLAHENFRTALITQWKELRSEGGVFSDENIIALLEDAEAQLDGAWQRNDEKYSYIFEKGTIPYANKSNSLENSQAEREYIKKFLLERGRWLDEHIDSIAELY